MRGPAKEQRQRLREGVEGEFLAMDFFDTHNIPYLSIEQSPHTWSQSLCSSNLKRPDFVFWNTEGDRRLLEVKHYTVHETSRSLRIPHSDFRSLNKHASDLGMGAILGFVLERKFLFFVKPEALVPPEALGQDYRIAVEPGPEMVQPAFQVKWIIPSAVVAWDALAGSNLGINKGLVISALFG